MAITSRFLIACLLAGWLCACGNQQDSAAIRPEVLLAQLQEAVRNPSDRCRLEGDEGGIGRRIERLMSATAIDILSVKKPSYEVEPALELLIRAPQRGAPVLSVLVYLQGGRCERFHLADMWEDKSRPSQP